MIKLSDTREAGLPHKELRQPSQESSHRTEVNFRRDVWSAASYPDITHSVIESCLLVTVTNQRYPQHHRADSARIRSPQHTHRLNPCTAEYNPPHLPARIRGSRNSQLTPHPLHLKPPAIPLLLRWFIVKASRVPPLPRCANTYQHNYLLHPWRRELETNPRTVAQPDTISVKLTKLCDRLHLCTSVHSW